MTSSILFARMEAHRADSHTLERYLATGGYQSLRRALGEMTPEQVTAEVKASNLRGRGGAGFPCGVKWGFLAADTPHYLVVNADESEPGTFKDRQLLERDPHQLVEGAAIAAYALGVRQAFVFVRGEYARPARRLQRAVEEAYAAGFLGQGIAGSGLRPGPHRPPRRRGLHLRGGDRPAQQPRGAARRAPDPASLPGGGRPLREADDRQQRRDDQQPALDHRPRRRRLRRHRAPGVAGHPPLLAVGPRPPPGQLRGGDGPHLARPDLRGAPGRRHPRGPGPEGLDPGRGLVPLAGAGPPRRTGHHRRRRPPGHDAGLRGGDRHGRDHRRGGGGPGHRALLRPRVLRAVHPLPRGHHLAAAGAGAHPAGVGPARPTSTCCSTSATTSPRGCAGRRRRPPSARWAPRPPLPIVSIMRHFRPEVEARITGGARG